MILTAIGYMCCETPCLGIISLHETVSCHPYNMTGI